MIGIYILKQDEEIVYIGQSINIEKRMMQHAKSEKKYNSVKTIKCDADSLDELEKKLIKKHKPRYNKTHNPYIEEEVMGEINLSIVEDYLMSDLIIKDENWEDSLRESKLYEDASREKVESILCNSKCNVLTTSLKATRFVLGIIKEHKLDKKFNINIVDIAKDEILLGIG